MIVVKVELHSAQDWSIQEIGRAHIWNDGTGTFERGNYEVGVLRRGDTKPWLGRYVRTGYVKNYPRQSYNVWRLIFRALRSAFDEEVNTERLFFRDLLRWQWVPQRLKARARILIDKLSQ